MQREKNKESFGGNFEILPDADEARNFGDNNNVAVVCTCKYMFVRCGYSLTSCTGWFRTAEEEDVLLMVTAITSLPQDMNKEKLKKFWR